MEDKLLEEKKFPWMETLTVLYLFTLVMGGLAFLIVKLFHLKPLLVLSLSLIFIAIVDGAFAIFFIIKRNLIKKTKFVVSSLSYLIFGPAVVMILFTPIILIMYSRFSSNIIFNLVNSSLILGSSIFIVGITHFLNTFWDSKEKNLFIPSQRFGYILITMGVGILLLSFSRFFMGMLDVNNILSEKKIPVGWPSSFVDVDFMGSEALFINWTTIIISLFGYLAIGYFIDISVSSILPLVKISRRTEEEMIEARKKFFSHKAEGMEDAKIREIFRNAGWKDKEIRKLS